MGRWSLDLISGYIVVLELGLVVEATGGKPLTIALVSV